MKGVFRPAERVPDWQVHVGQNKVLEDDVVFLHEQEAESVTRGGYCDLLRCQWLLDSRNFLL